MIPRKPLWTLSAAVLLSAALHAMVITGVAVERTAAPEPQPALSARLVPPPAPAPAAIRPPPAAASPVKAAKKRRAPPRRQVIAVAPAPATPAFVMPEAAAEPLEPLPSVQPEPQPVEAAAPAPPEVVAIAPPTTFAAPEPPPALPRRGRIGYTLFLGTDRFEIGRTVQTWEVEDGEYRIGSASETTGLAAVLRSEKRTYLSTGAVTRTGLQPKSFLMSRTRRGETEVARARFDWDAAQIVWGTTDDTRSAALPAGSQDFLSLMYQFALIPPPAGRVSVPLTTGTKFETYELDVLPHETIDTPLGLLRALPLRQVRRPGAETIQIWLASDYRYLPVMVRFYGRDGEPTGEQVVNELRLTE